MPVGASLHETPLVYGLSTGDPSVIVKLVARSLGSTVTKMSSLVPVIVTTPAPMSASAETVKRDGSGLPAGSRADAATALTSTDSSFAGSVVTVITVASEDATTTLPACIVPGVPSALTGAIVPV